MENKKSIIIILIMIILILNINIGYSYNYNNNLKSINKIISNVNNLIDNSNKFDIRSRSSSYSRSTSKSSSSVSKSATTKSATTKSATTKSATPKSATTKSATPKSATPKTTTKKVSKSKTFSSSNVFSGLGGFALGYLIFSDSSHPQHNDIVEDLDDYCEDLGYEDFKSINEKTQEIECVNYEIDNNINSTNAEDLLSEKLSDPTTWIKSITIGIIIAIILSFIFS